MIIEDHPDSALHLEEILLIQKLIPVKKIKIFDSLFTAEYYIRDHSVDILFLDLDLRGEDGFSILKSLKELAFKTVIVSGYTERAIEAFEYGVLDFIPKPASPKRLEKSIKLLLQNRFRFLQNPSIYAKQEDTLINIFLSDIIYIEAEGDRSFIKHINKGRFFTGKNISSLQSLLPDDFYRAQKSYIINLNRVEEIISERGGKYSARMNNGEMISVSRKNIKDLKNRIGVLF